MARKPISRELVEEMAKKHGFRMSPPDHPVYSEGPSIIFLSRQQQQSKPVVVESQRSGSGDESTGSDAG